MSISRYHSDDTQIGGSSAETLLPADRLAGDYSRQAGDRFVFLTKLLRRHARLIATIFLAGLGATFVILQLISPRYVATARILLDTRQQRVFSADTVLPALNDNLFIVDSQLEIIRSTRIAGRVLKAITRNDFAPSSEKLTGSELLPRANAKNQGSVQLAGLKATKGADKGSADANPSATETQAPPEVLENVLRGLAVERKGRSYVVEVSYSDLSGERAATIANAFVDAYVADQLEAKFQATRAANLWLSERIREIGSDLDAAEQDKQKFRAEHGLVEVGELSLLQRELADYSLQLVSARVSVADAEARLDQVRTLSGDREHLLSLDTSLDSKVISDFRRQAGEVQRRIGEGVSRYGELHPTVLAAKAELQNLNLEIEKEIQRIVENRELNLQAANGKVKLLEQGLEQLKSKALRLGESQIFLTKIQREIDASSTLYSTLLRRYKETSAQEKLQASDARVISYALTPSRPSFPKTGVTLLLAGLAWLGIGVGVGLACDRTQSVFHRPEDVERTTGVRCVAAIPVVDPCQQFGAGEVQRNLLGPMHWRVDDEFGGSFNQEIFKLRQWSIAGQRKFPHVVLVAGVHAADGCSTAAMQMARFAVSTGLNAALVDADLRYHGLTDVLNAETEATYADVVLGGADLESTNCHIVDQGVRVYPAPAGDCRPLDLLGSRQMGHFLRALRNEFDVVVIDTAPMASNFDADALLEHADQVLLVVKAGQTPRDSVLAALHRLGEGEDGISIGVVLNMVTNP